GKALFPKKTRKNMGIYELRVSIATHLITMDYTKWQVMYGNGVPIGLQQTFINGAVRTIQKVRKKGTTVSCAVVHTYVITHTVIDIASLLGLPIHQIAPLVTSAFAL